MTSVGKFGFLDRQVHGQRLGPGDTVDEARDLCVTGGDLFPCIGLDGHVIGHHEADVVIIRPCPEPAAPPVFIPETENALA